MPRLLALFLMGSEVRQFGHSGLLAQLLDQGWQITIAAKIVDDDLRLQIDPRLELVALPGQSLSFATAQAQLMLDSANAARKARQGATGWVYNAPVTPQTYRQRLLFELQSRLVGAMSSKLSLFRLGQQIERQLLLRETVAGWDKLFAVADPDVLLLNIPKAANLAAGLARAQARGIKTMLLYHTWKDVTVASGRLNHAFSAIGVWNERMRTQFSAQNLWVDPQTVQVAGCTHFDCVGQLDRLLPEQEFRQRLGLKHNSRLVLFTASPTWVVTGEDQYVELLHKAIQCGDLPGDLQIIVRTNPMEVSDLWSSVGARHPEIAIMKPDWGWVRKKNWCYQRHADFLLYNSLLHYAALNVSIPSTVTVECAIADLPIVNIGFELAGVTTVQGGVHPFWEADFYQDVRFSGAAPLACSVEELIKLVRQTLEHDERSDARRSLVELQLGVPPGLAAMNAVGIIEQLEVLGSNSSQYRR